MDEPRSTRCFRLAVTTLVLAGGCRADSTFKAVGAVDASATSPATADRSQVAEPYSAAILGTSSPNPIAPPRALRQSPEIVLTSANAPAGPPAKVGAPARSSIPPTAEPVAPPNPFLAGPPAPAPVPVLEVEPLVAEIVARNPDVRSAIAAWQAAAQRYPQEIALDDPMLGVFTGPGSFGNSTVETAYAIEVRQKLPWPGKRQLRGAKAAAETRAAYMDIGEERLAIAEAAQMAYYDYFLAYRQLTVLDESRKLMQSFRDIARTKYESSQVDEQDVLLADVELAQLDRRKLELARMACVARARINTLLLMPPDAPLAPPPTDLSIEVLAESDDDLQRLAVAQRPELAAQAARISAERDSVALACKEFYPDVEVMARYDWFWQEDPLRPMVGVNLNLPLYKQKRDAAVCEARARVAKEQADLDSRAAELAFEVEQAFQRVEESRQTLDVYKNRLLPTAERSVDSARASYLASRLDFLRLVESQRQSLSLQDSYYEAMAEYHRRLAELDRTVGAPLPGGQ